MAEQVEVGAFEALGISGVSLARGGTAMGIRLGTPHPALGLFDDKDVLLTLEAPTAYAPDVSYVSYSWRVPVTPAGLRTFTRLPRNGVNSATVYDYTPEDWARVTLAWYRDGDVVSARYVADRPIAAALFVNGCFTPAMVEAPAEHGCLLRQGEERLMVRLAGQTEKPFLLESRQQAERALAGLPVEGGTALAVYPVTLAPETPLYVVLTLAETQEAPAPAEIDRQLAARAEAYAAARMRSSGAFAGAAEAIAGLAGYGRAYDPRRQRLQTVVNRSWAGPNAPGPMFGWDNFFTSYLAAWENPALAAASLEHVVGSYGERGIAEGPTQRNLIIPIIYCKTLAVLGDEALARRTWPVMLDFMRFWFEDRGDGRPWRDSNGDGLIESGTSLDPRRHTLGYLIQNAMDETGYDDFPVYSAGFTDGRRALLADGVSFGRASQTLDVTLVCQNSLYIAAARMMARLAARLEHHGEALWLRGEAERVSACMRARLFDAQTGVFRDRRADGSFSPTTVMTRFYPLLAGLADRAMQGRLRECLLDQAQFWGDNLIPTVSRQDPAYCDGLDGQGNYWRGNCWPPTTYIVYLAIKEAGWDDIAAEYARRVYRQFMEYWTAYGHAYENYPPEGTVDHTFIYPSGWGGREVRYTWAGLMPLCGLEEAFAPEVGRPGVRFGNPHLRDEVRWERFTFAGQRMSAIAGPTRTAVTCGEQWAFTAEPGVIVRGFTCDAQGMHFSVIARAETSISLDAVGLAGKRVLVDDLDALAERTATGVRFTVSAGEHQVGW